MDSKSALILGGARSGKSKFGEKLALQTALTPIYIATAEALDDEMKNRIRHHQQQRASSFWQTIEEPIHIAQVIETQVDSDCVILVDCLTLWLSNMMLAGKDINKQTALLIAAIKNISCPIIFISNEVGMGIVPTHQLGRDFRDQAGRLNQQLAELLPNCYFIIAGLPFPLKKDNQTLLESLPL